MIRTNGDNGSTPDQVSTPAQRAEAEPSGADPETPGPGDRNARPPTRADADTAGGGDSPSRPENMPAPLPAAGQSRGRSRTSRILARCLALLPGLVRFSLAVLLFVFLASSVLLWRLAQGPVSLEPFVAPLESHAGRLLSGTDIRLTLGGARLSWPSWRDSPTITLQDLGILGTGGRPLGMVPEVRVLLSPGRLLRGEMPVRSLEVSQPALYLVRRADGSTGIRIDLDDGTGNPAKASDVRDETVSDMGQWFPDGSTGALAIVLETLAPLKSLSLSLQDGTFNFENRKNGADFEVRDINFTLDIRPTRIGLTARGTCEPPSTDPQTPVPPTRLGVSATLLRDQTELASLQMEVRHLSLEDLARIAATVSGDPLSPHPAPGEVDPDPQPAETADTPEPVQPTGSPAVLPGSAADDTAAQPPAPPTTGEEATIALPGSFQEWREAIQGEFDVSVRMQVHLPSLFGAPEQAANEADTDLAARIRAAIRGASLRAGSGSVTLNLPCLPAPVTLRELEMKALATAEAREVALRSFQLRLPEGGRVTVSAEINDPGSAPRIHINTGFEAVDVPDLLALWPIGAAENARLWLLDNVIAGHMDQGSIRVELAGPDWEDLDFAGMEGSARIREASLWCRKPLPPLERVEGILEFRTDTISGQVSSGGVRGFEDLAIRAGRFAFTGIDQEDQDADIEVEVEGSLASTLTVLDMEPFGYASELGIRPDDVKGQVQGLLRFRFPMLADLDFDQIRLEAKAGLEAVALPDILRGLDLTGGRMTLDLTEDGMDVQGTASLGPVSTQIQWRENFASIAPFRSRYHVTGQLDETGRKAIGFEIPREGPFSGRGPMDFTAVVERRDATTTDVDVKIDIARSELNIPALGWKKDPGQPGELAISGRLGARKGQLDIRATAKPDARLGGVLSLATEGSRTRPTLFDIRELRVLDNRIRGAVTWNPDGSLAIVLGEGHLDLRPFFQPPARSEQPSSPPQPAESGTAEPGTPFTLRAALDSLRIDDTLFLDTVILDGTHSGAAWSKAGGTGRIRDGGQFRFTVKSPQPPDTARSFTFDATDAGLLLKALGALDTIKGGTLTVSGTIQPDSTVEGLAKMANFRVTNAPVLAKIISVAGLTGILDAFKGPGLGFSSFRAPFRYKDGVLILEDASAKSSSIGLTTSGTVNRTAGTLSLHGTIIPAYAINSLLGYIPLIGDLLQGGKDEGLFAANYTVSGGFDDPKVSVNPLSVLAPGFLRGIFNVFSSEK